MASSVNMMPGMNGNGAEKRQHVEHVLKEEAYGHTFGAARDEDRKVIKPMSTSPGQEEKLKKKYGGLRPKLPSLKMAPRSFFNSADWEMAKGVTAPIELLPPKLQPKTPHPPPGRSLLAHKCNHDTPIYMEGRGDTSCDDPTPLNLVQ